jgi:hypothetical protein
MAVAEDPLRYIRRFLLIEEDLGGIQALSDEDENAPLEFSEQTASRSNGRIQPNSQQNFENGDFENRGKFLDHSR